MNARSREIDEQKYGVKRSASPASSPMSSFKIIDRCVQTEIGLEAMEYIFATSGSPYLVSDTSPTHDNVSYKRPRSSRVIDEFRLEERKSADVMSQMKSNEATDTFYLTNSSNDKSKSKE
jgi:hypothetical protein